MKSSATSESKKYKEITKEFSKGFEDGINDEIERLENSMLALGHDLDRMVWDMSDG